MTPNTPGTKLRNVRFDDDLWEDLGKAAELLGVDRSALLREYASWAVRRTKAKAPRRPDVEAWAQEAVE